MNTNATQQEVLLMTGTGFSARQYSEKDATDSTNNTSENEQLKEACWNGLLKEMLPEVFILNEASATLYLWQVREANKFFAIEMSEFPMEVNKYLSIDPYRFMEIQGMN